MFMLTARGKVQLWEQDGKRGLIVSDTRAGIQAAAKLIHGLRKSGRLIKGGKRTASEQRLSVAEIGTVPGETLEGHFLASLDFGTSGVWFTNGERLWWGTPKEAAA